MKAIDLIPTIGNRFPDITFRPARIEDSDRLYELYEAMDKADQTSWAGSPEDARQDFEDPAANAEEDSLVAVTPEGQIVGASWIFLQPRAERSHRAFIWGGVHPDHRQRGIGTTIMGWGMQRSSQRLLQLQDGLPKWIRVSSGENQADQIQLFERFGFQPVRRYFRMRRDLSQPIPDRIAPEGVEIQTWSPELDEQVYEVITDAFRDHWASEPMTRESWEHHILQSTSFRPQCTFVALKDGQVIGASVNYIRTEDNERAGIHEGWIGSLGVRRAWRGRGLASLLLCESMRKFKEMDLDSTGLTVDSENLTGALGLYEKLGFQTVRRTVAWEQPPLE